MKIHSATYRSIIDRLVRASQQVALESSRALEERGYKPVRLELAQDNIDSAIRDMIPEGMDLEVER